MRRLYPLASLLFVGASVGCAEDTVPDSPAAGASGAGTSGAGGSGGASAGAAGSGGSTDAGTGTGGGKSGAGGTGGVGTGGSGAGGSTAGASGAGGSLGGSSGAGGAGATDAGGSGGGGTGGGTMPDASVDGSGGSTDAGMEAGRPRDPECDLNGRWLLAQRNSINLPLGQCQGVHTWFYYEVRHVGEQITVTKGLHCGFEAVKISALATNVVNEAMRPAILANNSSAGRTGTFVKEADQCHLTLPIEYVVNGATVSYYKDPSRPLPVMGSAAAGPGGMPPGWEDWDNDGQPGYTLVINSTAASGSLYQSTRESNALDGLAPVSSPLFKVPMTMTSQQSVLGTAPGSSPLITMGGTPSSDPATHFTYFMKLQDGQAVGTDAEICEQVRTLRNSLPGDANDMPPPTTCR